MGGLGVEVKWLYYLSKESGIIEPAEPPKTKELENRAILPLAELNFKRCEIPKGYLLEGVSKPVLLRLEVNSYLYIYLYERGDRFNSTAFEYITDKCILCRPHRRRGTKKIDGFFFLLHQKLQRTYPKT